MYFEYAAHAAKQYRVEKVDSVGSDETAAGDFTTQLQTLFSKLPEEDRPQVIQEIDEHAEYLFVLTQKSTSRMQTVIRNVAEAKSENLPGPGIFLSKWQTLMDDTRITPITSSGSVRNGDDQSVIDATRVDTDGAKKGTMNAHAESQDLNTKPPGVSNVVRTLSLGFRDALRGLEAK